MIVHADVATPICREAPRNGDATSPGGRQGRCICKGQPPRPVCCILRPPEASPLSPAASVEDICATTAMGAEDTGTWGGQLREVLLRVRRVPV